MENKVQENVVRIIKSFKLEKTFKVMEPNC